MFCGSSDGTDPAYAEVGAALGRLLAERGVRLVYGGSAIGLMSVVANAALAAGGEVVGVIPRRLFRREVAHRGLTELIEVESMHERKQAMFERSDAFVALPGGLGTLDELAEIATWAQLGIHDRPVVTLDVGGFWRPFHDFLRQAAEAGFVKKENLDLIVNVDQLDRLLPTLEADGP